MANPPLWVLRQTILPYGARLEPNREKWEEPKIVYTYPPKKRTPPGKNTFVTWTNMRGELQRFDYETQRVVTLESGELAVFPKAPQKPTIGNLDKSEYFQWLGCRSPMSCWAKCRACGHVCWNVGAREYHKNGCGRVLNHAYKLLCADVHRPTGQLICAICLLPTKRKMWGLPLCEDVRCEEFWKFGGDNPHEGRIPNSLKEAIILVKFREGG